MGITWNYRRFSRRLVRLVWCGVEGHLLIVRSYVLHAILPSRMVHRQHMMRSHERSLLSLCKSDPASRDGILSWQLEINKGPAGQSEQKVCCDDAGCGDLTPADKAGTAKASRIDEIPPFIRRRFSKTPLRWQRSAASST